MKKELTFKPSYLKFLKHRLGFKQPQYILGSENSKYEEIEKTKKITNNLSYVYILPMIAITSFKWFINNSFLNKFIIIFASLILYIFILETIHWFYAQFTLLEENGNLAQDVRKKPVSDTPE